MVMQPLFLHDGLVVLSFAYHDCLVLLGVEAAVGRVLLLREDCCFGSWDGLGLR